MKKRNPYQPEPVPPWLSDPGLIGPCMCGDYIDPDEAMIIASSQWGTKRWWHPECWYAETEGMDYEDG